MEINVISKQSSMKRGSFCDIVNVNKEKQRRNDSTLADPTRYTFCMKI